MKKDLWILFLCPTLIWLILPFTVGGITLGSMVISYIIAFISVSISLTFIWACEKR